MEITFFSNSDLFPLSCCSACLEASSNGNFVFQYILKLLGMYVQSVKMMFAFFDKLSRNEKATYKARDT